MCLKITSCVPERLKFKNGLVKVYKVLIPQVDGRLLSPLRSFVYEPGLNKALGDIDCADENGYKAPMSYGKHLHGGAIHVFTTVAKALWFAEDGEVIIPVFAKKSDFIAEGSENQAAFKAIYISKKNYAKALKAKNRDSLVKNEIS